LHFGRSQGIVDAARSRTLVELIQKTMMRSTGKVCDFLSMRVPVVCTLALVSGILSGCNTIRGFPNPPKTVDVAMPEPDWELGPQAIKAYNNAPNPDAQKTFRNEIIDARLAALDRAFGDYERAIYQEDVKAGLGTDFALLALTAGTTVVGAASTKTALGAASVAVAGGAASFDKRTLFDKTLPALLAQMVAGRETIRAQIAANKKLATADYSWSAADSDLQRFAFAGSLVGAIAGVTQDAGQKAAAAKQLVQDVTNGVFQNSTNSQILEAFWKPDGTLSTDNEAKLKDWMTHNGIGTAPGMITMFIHSAIFEPARAKAVKDLELSKSP
jgi:hypothetical protein